MFMGVRIVRIDFRDIKRVVRLRHVDDLPRAHSAAPNLRTTFAIIVDSSGVRLALPETVRLCLANPMDPLYCAVRAPVSGIAK